MPWTLVVGDSFEVRASLSERECQRFRRLASYLARTGHYSITHVQDCLPMVPRPELLSAVSPQPWKPRLTRSSSAST